MQFKQLHPTDKVYSFRVEISGIEPLALVSVSELTVDIDVIERWDRKARITRKYPGRKHVSNVIFRGVAGVPTPTLDSWIEVNLAPQSWWRRLLRLPKLDRRAGVVVLLDSEGTPMRKFVLHDCWPCRWSSGAWSSDTDGPRVWELELCLTSFELGKL
jgi:phage tail-like protein